MTAEASCHGDTAPSTPRRRRPAATHAPTASTASANTLGWLGSGPLSGSSCTSNAVNTERTISALHMNARSQPRTVDAGRASRVAIGRCPRGEGDLADDAGQGVERRRPKTRDELAGEHRERVTTALGVTRFRMRSRDEVERSVPQYGPGESQDRRAVGKRVVDPPHQRRSTVGERPDQVHAPQRPASIESLVEQAGDLDAQAFGVEGLRRDHLADMGVEIHRHRPPDRRRGRPVQAPGQLRRGREPPRHPGA